MDIPALARVPFLAGVRPVNFTNGVGAPVTIELKQQPSLTVTYSSDDAAHALPAEITAMEYTQEGAIGSAPVTDLPRPAKTVVDTADIQWDWKANAGMTRTQSACGGVTYNTKWTPTIKQNPSPAPNGTTTPASITGSTAPSTNPKSPLARTGVADFVLPLGGLLALAGVATVATTRRRA